MFAKIANAYEILFDAEKREQYDYAVAHPEEFFYNTARYYQTYYIPKTDTRVILLAALILLSSFQYLNDSIRYKQAIDYAKQTPAYRNRLKQLELERKAAAAAAATAAGGGKGKRGGGRKGGRPSESQAQTNVSSGDVEAELELQVHGADKPSLWRLLGVQLVILPYKLGKLMWWQLQWAVRYSLHKQPYAWADAAHLTRTTLRIPPAQWNAMGDATRERLIDRQLWVKGNLEAYREEMMNNARRRGR
eukprot:TRINITY_DN19402_c0_g1_i1.p1 TRINITY_DN19402_c0_g1~~TRINITY_DN19402_c0_g1_i1.p1  ORF type:complete len:248 (-),score=20.67 TRINITY_DN19402_c0_g1_i1:94-837(-)